MTPGAIAMITGELSDLDDVDVYRIHIAALSQFEALIFSDETQVLDTSLFLFNALGQAVIGNDDDPNRVAPFEFHSTIPLGAVSGGAETAGDYYLAISVFPVRPVNGADELFTDAFDADQLLIPANNLSATGWAPQPNPDITGVFGNYRIDLQGVSGVAAAAVPEPSSLVVFGALLSLTVLRRQKPKARHNQSSGC